MRGWRCGLMARGTPSAFNISHVLLIPRNNMEINNCEIRLYEISEISFGSVLFVLEDVA